MQHEPVQDNIEQKILAYTELGNKICTTLISEAVKTGIDSGILGKLCFDELEFTLSRDPFSQQDSLEGRWYGPHKNLLGSILFHADGSFFAEHDVAQEHPARKGWFIEAVSAWGNQECIKSEARLLPMPE